ncbi:efflux RND transporter periplasmic adaptor subunit [Bradyrhizobium sp. USDA 4461]
MKGDFPIYVRSIGTVQAYNTVSIVSRVDGEVQKVAYREGQHVKAGELLVQIDPRLFEAQLRQAEAARDRDKALLATAELDFGRSSQLVGQGYATRQTYDTQKNQIAQLEAALRSDEATIEFAKLQLTYSRVCAPFDGRTGMRQLDQGNMVRANAGTTLVLLTQTTPISVVFAIPQESLPELLEASNRGANLEVVAYAQQGGDQALATGTLETIDNAVDSSTGSIRLKATFANEHDELWPGQFVNVRLRFGARTDGVIIPAQAVLRNQDGNYAWVVRPDRTVEPRPIKVARIERDQALIVGGLAPKTTVVADGHSRLRPGSKIQDNAVATDAGAGQHTEMTR